MGFMASRLMIVHFAATWYLVGLCWLVQRVQYPLMQGVGSEHFAAYEAAHVARIGPVVAPMMLLELATAVFLWRWGGVPYRRPGFVVAMGLLGVVWISTFLIQVPLHDVLRGGFDAEVHARLVWTNWIRTLAWSARGLLLCGLMASMLSSADSTRTGAVAS
jgi:hypothetical protein